MGRVSEYVAYMNDKPGKGRKESNYYTYLTITPELEAARKEYQRMLKKNKK